MHAHMVRDQIAAYFASLHAGDLIKVDLGHSCANIFYIYDKYQDNVDDEKKSHIIDDGHLSVLLATPQVSFDGSDDENVRIKIDMSVYFFKQRSLKIILHLGENKKFIFENGKLTIRDRYLDEADPESQPIGKIDKIQQAIKKYLKL